MELRIATYNIHKGASIDHRPIIQELKRSIRSLGADVIFLQEVQGRHDLMTNRHALLWQDKGQHAYLAGNSLYCAWSIFKVPATFFIALICAAPPTRETEIPTSIAGRNPSLNKSVSR